MMKRRGAVGMLAAVVALAWGCGPQTDPDNGTMGENQAAPDLSIPLKKGATPVSLSSLKGKVVLLDFWATWCGPCRESIPEIERIYKKYHGRGLEVVGISVDEVANADKIPGVVKELGMTYPVVLYTDIPDVRTKYEFSSIPQMYIIDKKGNISQSIPGFKPDSNLDAKIEALLNAKA
jgi:cytochrome c biogenesis protein CcmG/thiol:disulfide interchange protein DsbE